MTMMMMIMIFNVTIASACSATRSTYVKIDCRELQTAGVAYLSNRALGHVNVYITMNQSAGCRPQERDGI
jgi:hypothetical protein